MSNKVFYMILERTPEMESTGQIITFSRFGRQLWSRANTQAENQLCAVCNNPVGKEAFQPPFNSQNVSIRICIDCGEKK